MATALSDVYGSVHALGGVPESYRPSANEEFMNPDQLAYFRRKLLGWKDEILRESQSTMASLKSGPIRAFRRESEPSRAVRRNGAKKSLSRAESR